MNRNRLYPYSLLSIEDMTFSKTDRIIKDQQSNREESKLHNNKAKE